MRQRYAERTGQPDRTAEVASHGEGAVNSGMYSGVDSVEDYRVDSGMDAGCGFWGLIAYTTHT